VNGINVPSNYIYNIISDTLPPTTSNTSDVIYGPKGQSYIVNIDSSKYCDSNFNLKYECVIDMSDPMNRENQNADIAQFDPANKLTLNNGQTCPYTINNKYIPKLQLSCVNSNTGDWHGIPIPTDACDSGYSLKGNNLCSWDGMATCSNNSFLDDNKCHTCPIGNLYFYNLCLSCSNPNSIISTDNMLGKPICISKCPDGYGMIKNVDNNKPPICIDLNWINKSTSSTYNVNDLISNQKDYNNGFDNFVKSSSYKIQK
jgi:hypothetical protein